MKLKYKTLVLNPFKCNLNRYCVDCTCVDCTNHSLDNKLGTAIKWQKIKLLTVT